MLVIPFNWDLGLELSFCYNLELLLLPLDFDLEEASIFVCSLIQSFSSFCRFRGASLWTVFLFLSGAASGLLWTLIDFDLEEASIQSRLRLHVVSLSFTMQWGSFP